MMFINSTTAPTSGIISTYADENGRIITISSSGVDNYPYTVNDSGKVDLSPKNVIGSQLPMSLNVSPVFEYQWTVKEESDTLFYTPPNFYISEDEVRNRLSLNEKSIVFKIEQSKKIRK